MLSCPIRLPVQLQDLPHLGRICKPRHKEAELPWRGACGTAACSSASPRASGHTLWRAASLSASCRHHAQPGMAWGEHIIGICRCMPFKLPLPPLHGCTSCHSGTLKQRWLLQTIWRFSCALHETSEEQKQRVSSFIAARLLH